MHNAVAAGVPVWCVGTGDRATLERALPVPLPMLEQRGSGLAERLAAAQADLFGCGYGRVLLLAADCPIVGPGYLAAAIARLDDAEVVLGRAADGGYSLIATRSPTPELFDGVPMSTGHTLDATIAAARHAGLDTVVLPSRRDLDTPGDLGVPRRRASSTTRPPPARCSRPCPRWHVRLRWHARRRGDRRDRARRPGRAGDR